MPHHHYWYLKQVPLITIGYFDAGEPDISLMLTFFDAYRTHHNILLQHEKEFLYDLWTKNALKLTMPKEKSPFDLSATTPEINFRKIKKL